MDRAYIQSNAIAHRYLTGSLSEAEARAFEAACAADPALADELDTDFKLKMGLERLAERGEIVLTALPQVPRTHRYAVAASILAAVGLATSAYLAVRMVDQQKTLTELRAANPAQSGTPILGRTERILRLRSDRIDVPLPAHGWIGLSMDATGLEGLDVNVELRRESGEIVSQQSFRVPDDGTVFLVADPAMLPAGNYTATLTPQATTAPPAAIAYRIRFLPSAPP